MSRSGGLRVIGIVAVNLEMLYPQIQYLVEENNGETQDKEVPVPGKPS
jgi:hypothetical protein